MIKLNGTTALAAVITCAVSAHPVMAQAAPVGESAQAEGLADIVVTAEKRSTSLQRTPIAITAITGEALERAQVRSLPDIATLVPNFQMGSVGGYAQITLRGIGISTFVPLAESAVAVNLNEVYVSRTIAQTAGMYDVSAIEVLRGPQGTLYGRNATAGAVNITTSRPGDAWSGYGRLTVGNFGLVHAEGAVGGPVVDDQIFVRVAGFREKRNGYGKNLATGSDIDDKDAWALRGTLVFKPSSAFKATVIAEHFDEDDRNGGYHYFGSSQQTGLPGAYFMPPTFILLGGRPVQNAYDIDNAIDPRFQLRTSAVTGIVEWNDGPVSLKSITGYRDQEAGTKKDISGGGFGGGFFDGGEDAKQFSQEIQARYSNSRLDLTIGGFYFKENNNFSPATVAIGNRYLNLNFYPFALPGVPLLPVPGYTNFAQTGGRVKTTAKAAFAQATYKVTDKLSVTAGIRYSDERKDLFQRYAIDPFTPFTGNNPLPPAVSIPGKSYSATTPKFGVQYQITPKTLIYVSYAKGFKSGGFDSGASPSIVALGFRPEKLTDYEGGIKTTFLDNRLRLNLSGFYYDYTDLQVLQVVGLTEVATSNAGSASNYGAELEVSAVVTPEFTIDANASWLHARYGTFSGPDNVLPTLSVIDFKGNQLSNAPDFRAHLAGAYTWTMPSGKLTLQAEGDYSSKFFFSPANAPIAMQGQFLKTNAFLTYASDADWRATVFVRNITNIRTKSGGFGNSALFGAPIVGSFAPPRTIGLELSYKF